jgi:hypothetical protein
MDGSLPAAIGSFIAATNSADETAFVASFTDDARLQDGGRVFHGREGAAQWSASDNIGVGMHFELVSWAETAPDAYDVTLEARSRRFTGTGTLHVTMREGLIATLATA